MSAGQEPPSVEEDDWTEPAASLYAGDLLLVGTTRVAVPGVGLARWRGLGPDCRDLPNHPVSPSSSRMELSRSFPDLPNLQGERAPNVAAPLRCLWRRTFKAPVHRVTRDASRVRDLTHP